jgi:hypothetical protein
MEILKIDGAQSFGGNTVIKPDVNLKFLFWLFAGFVMLVIGGMAIVRCFSGEVIVIGIIALLIAVSIIDIGRKR